MFKRVRNKELLQYVFLNQGDRLELRIDKNTEEGKKKRNIIIGNRLDKRSTFNTASFHEFENEFGLKNGYVVIVGRKLSDTGQEVQQLPVP